MAQCLAHSQTFSHVCYGCIYFHKLELLQEADKRGKKGMIPQFIGSCHVDEKLSVSFRIQNGNLPFFGLQLREFHYHHPIHFCDLKCHSTSVYHLTWGWPMNSSTNRTLGRCSTRVCQWWPDFQPSTRSRRLRYLSSRCSWPRDVRRGVHRQT